MSRVYEIEGEIAGSCAMAPQLKNSKKMLMTRYDMPMIPIVKKTPAILQYDARTNMNDIHAKAARAPKAHRFVMIPALRHGLFE
ncbi:MULTISPECIES: hypothetical protein [Pseudomonas]|jgi:hypothetical protein|uniref:hypothetical protein n=1 Tax=Pseudomonas TaxID=286 RepID=UPI0015A6228A|nr:MULTISPECIES: hypothetical protein [Pseudomonas]MBB6153091.1 hypothetical protein [Pseudomonas sp. JAI115]